MSLSAWCPRCRERLDPASSVGECPRHGRQPPLWRPGQTSYDAFTAHLRLSGSFPSYVPWPLAAGWRISDFGVVAGGSGRAVATVTCCTGATEADGRVDVLVVAEETGVGLGGRCAGLPTADPGQGFGVGPPTARVRIGSRGVPLWPVSTSTADGELDRSVVAGEALGRWLWIVLLPAPAVLLMKDPWILRDVSGEGPHLVALPFDGPGPVW
jgi:hypothetical protein